MQIPDNKINIVKRIKTLRVHFGLNSGEFASKAGIDPRNYSSIETGKRTIGERVLRDICNAFDVNIDWILTGEGDMLKQNSSLPQTREHGVIRYWVDIQATGSGTLQFEDCDSSQYLDLRIPEFRDCTDAINLYGDSMEPKYRSGQIIILKKWTESYIDFGNTYLIVTKGGHRMIKVLRSVHDNSNQVSCVSYNPDYSPFPIDKSDIVNLFLVKGVIEKTTL